MYTMKDIEVTEIQLFPNVDWNINSFMDSNIIFNPYQSYQKARINRYWVAGSGGPTLLSVPLKGGRNQKQALCDIEPAKGENWEVRHWRTLNTVYNKSPFFEYYRDSVESLLMGEHRNLFDLCLSSINWMLNVLRLPVEYSIIESKEGCTYKRVRQYGSYKYPQVFEDRTGFIPHLSGLDLIFNLGPRAGQWLLKEIEKRNE